MRFRLLVADEGVGRADAGSAQGTAPRYRPSGAALPAELFSRTDHRLRVSRRFVKRALPNQL
jgi:hypothetical protein